MSWQTFLESASPAEHAVQVYTELDELAESVGRFLDAGFRVGEPALVIATPEHWESFRAELERRGADLDELQAVGMLTCLDADESLALFMDGDVPVAERFEEAVGGVLDEVAGRFPEKTVRAFGEMVDLLSQRGHQAAAIALEDLWNDLAAVRRFALFCAYPLQGFDDSARAAFRRICQQHTAVMPSDHALDGASASQERIISDLRAETAALRDELERLRTAQRAATTGWEGFEET